MVYISLKGGVNCQGRIQMTNINWELSSNRRNKRGNFITDLLGYDISKVARRYKYCAALDYNASAHTVGNVREYPNPDQATFDFTKENHSLVNITQRQTYCLQASPPCHEESIWNAGHYNYGPLGILNFAWAKALQYVVSNRNGQVNVVYVGIRTAQLER